MLSDRSGQQHMEFFSFSWELPSVAYALRHKPRVPRVTTMSLVLVLTQHIETIARWLRFEPVCTRARVQHHFCNHSFTYACVCPRAEQLLEIERPCSTAGSCAIHVRPAAASPRAATCVVCRLASEVASALAPRHNGRTWSHPSCKTSVGRLVGRFCKD